MFEQVVALVINLSDRQLCTALLNSDTIVECYPVAVGKPSTPTPTGTFTVDSIITNPILTDYREKSRVVLPKGILGNIAIDLGEHPNIKNSRLAIHGTNQPEKIGLPVSLGCVRMTNEDIENLVYGYLFNTVIIQN